MAPKTVIKAKMKAAPSKTKTKGAPKPKLKASKAAVSLEDGTMVSVLWVAFKCSFLDDFWGFWKLKVPGS